jgi:hypothetical protein
MITYLLEDWHQYYSDPDREALWREHYEVLREAHLGRMEMGPDIGMYEGFERAGQLQILVARKAGKMIGYCLVVIRPHIHYCRTLCAFEDSYFVTEAERSGLSRVGYELIRRSLIELRRRGVKRAFYMTKEFASIARLLTHFGGEKLDEVYAFWLDDLAIGD